MCTTYRLCYFAPSPPWSSLRILYGFPPPSLSSPPTWPTITIQTTEQLASQPNKYFWQMVICPLTWNYLTQPSPNLPLPPGVPENHRPVIFGLVQGSSCILELCYPLHHFISLSHIYNKLHLPGPLGNIYISPLKPHTCCSVSPLCMFMILRPFRWYIHSSVSTQR